MHGIRRWLFAGALSSAAMLAGCKDSFDCNGSNIAPAFENPPAPPAEETVLRPLTGKEYDNTVRDLLGDTSQPGRFFPQQDTTIGFETAPPLTSLSMEFLLVAAEQVAADAMNRLPQLLPCDPTMITDDTCPQQFIASLARRAYRQPVADADLQALYDLYSATKADEGVTGGLQTAIEAILMSPRFLYLREDNPAQASNGSEPLTSYELASRLSYALWNTMPDDALSAAADSGQLSVDTIGDQARRMLADPKAKDAVTNFFTQWLQLDILDTISRDVFIGDPGFPSSMRLESQEFTSHVFFDDGHYQTLLTAPYSYVDKRAALLYNVTPPPDGTVARVDLPSVRSGLLTEPSFLTIHALPTRTSPTQRGKFIRERLLCQPLPAPPPNVVQNLDIGQSQASVRDLVKQHMTNPACNGCHSLMDPIGLGFEAFDNEGHYIGDGASIDVSGSLTNTQDVDGAFNGPVELSQKLAQSKQVADCMARQWFRFMLRRQEQTTDQGSLSSADAALAAADGDLREMIIALTKTDSFTHHTDATAGNQ